MLIKLLLAFLAALIASLSCGMAIMGSIYSAEVALAQGVSLGVTNGYMWSGFMLAGMVGIMHVVGQIGYFRAHEKAQQTTLFLLWVPLPMVLLFIGGFFMLMPFLSQHQF